MQVIKDIDWHLKRLNPNPNMNLDIVLRHFIIDEEFGTSFSLDKVRDKELFLHQALKILSLMEASDTWKDFEKLVTKQKKNKKKNEITDFDKLLKGLMKVPKPDKKKK